MTDLQSLTASELYACTSSTRKADKRFTCPRCGAYSAPYTQSGLKKVRAHLAVCKEN